MQDSFEGLLFKPVNDIDRLFIKAGAAGIYGRRIKDMGRFFGTDGFRGEAGSVLTAEHA